MARTPLPVSRLARYELRRFRGPLPKLALVFVLIVPLLYGAIYLTANWDPYGKLDRLPVAVVDHDRPATANGSTITAGDDLVDDLHEGAKFDWQDVTDDATAAAGLGDGTYFMTLTIPADFSADLVSGQGDDPERAEIMLRRDDANGFVVGNITASAENSVARAVDESAEESYFDAVFANLATIRQGLTKAADGSSDLSDGIDDAARGAGRLSTGSRDAAAGADDLSTGAASLATGLDSASTGATDLATGLGRLDTGSGTLAKGAHDVADGTQQLDDTLVPPLKALQRGLDDVGDDTDDVSDTLATIADGAAGQTTSVAEDLAQASDDLATLRRDHPELVGDPAFERLGNRVDTASTRADTIALRARAADEKITSIGSAVGGSAGLSAKINTATRGIDRLNRGVHDVADGADTLHTSIGTASTGADTLATGVQKADTGATELATGASDLATGLDTLHDGAVSLDTGLGQLSTGAATLHTGLTDGAARIPAVTPGEQADAVQVLSSPADVTTTVANPAGVYGRGLAPLFLSIALWVFGISVFLVVRPISGRSLAGRAGPLRLALAGWLPVAGIAVAGGWLMISTVWLFLGLDPVRPWTFVGLTTLGALTFSAIAHLLRTALGTVGSSLLLVWLILQLASAGGTYPSVLLPPFFAAIGRYLPMTYLVDAYRVTISGGLTGHLVRDVVVLAVIAVVVLSLTVAVVARRQQFALKDLHPPLTAP